MSDSIVLILTLKFLGCFLNSALNPIFAAKALAMSTGGYTNYTRRPTRQVKGEAGTPRQLIMFVADGRGVVCPRLGVRRQRRRACDRPSVKERCFTTSGEVYARGAKKKKRLLCMDVLHTLRKLIAWAILHLSAKMKTQSWQFYDSSS